MGEGWGNWFCKDLGMFWWYGDGGGGGVIYFI